MIHRRTYCAALSVILMISSEALAGVAHVRSYAFRAHDNDTSYVQNVRFGCAVSTAGNVDADGFDDFIVGAREDPTGGSHAGSVHVFSGATGTVLYYIRGDPGDYMGSRVGGGGDVDNDGHDDFLVEADEDCRIYSGATGALLRTLADAAHDCAIAGDVDNDGHDDVIIYGYSGVRVHSGATGTLLHHVAGPSSLGSGGVRAAGHWDQDGFADFVIGDVGDSTNGRRAGAAFVYSGRTGARLQAFYGDTADDYFGNVDSAGDVNNDGFVDLIVGAPGNEGNQIYNSGMVRVFSGADGAILYTFNGTGVNDSFGGRVAGVGDINGDGFDDVMAGSPEVRKDGLVTGMIRVYSGASGAVLYTYYGPVDKAFGDAISGIGDANGDGLADFAICAPNDAFGGSSWLYLSVVTPGDTHCPGDADDSGAVDLDDITSALTAWGALCPPPELAHSRLLSSPLYPPGPTAADSFGAAVSATGAHPTTGAIDLLVGAPLDDDILYGRVDSGAVIRFDAVTGAMKHRLRGDASGDQFGFSISAGARINADIYPDFVVGAPFADSSGQDAGRARVISGGPPSIFMYTFDGDAPGDSFGWSVAIAGDVNGDGAADVIVGAPFNDSSGDNAGMARIFSGLDGSTLRTIYGDAAGDRFGWSVGSAGDFNNDGVDDVLIGAPFSDLGGADSGVARIYDGADGSVLHTFIGDGVGHEWGFALQICADVNNDGSVDLVIGAPGADVNGPASGMARVLSGADGAILHTFLGAGMGHRFGAAVSPAGDFDGDGHADVFVAAPQDSRGHANAGSACVFSGADGALLLEWLGGQEGGQLGFAIAFLGDVNADGAPDLFIGAPAENLNASGSGIARVVQSVAGAPDPCFGDADKNLVVDFADITAILSNWMLPCP